MFDLLKELKNRSRTANPEPIILGLYAEGLNLQAVWLEKQQYRVLWLGAENIVLPEPLELAIANNPPHSEKPAQSAPDDGFSEIQQIDALYPDLEPAHELDGMADAPEDITTEIEANLGSEHLAESEKHTNASVIRGLLNRFPDRRLKIAIPIAEPQVYYTRFESDWGLTSKKLSRKIGDELLKQKSNSDSIKPDAMDTLKFDDGSLLVITRDPEIGLLSVIDQVRGSLDVRMPQISVVESAEISMVNLVKGNYPLQEKEITVIVYVGNEFSRLIFLEGERLSHIAPIISEGIELFFPRHEALMELAQKIRSRLLLEQDNLNIGQIHRIILAGNAGRKEFQEVFLEWFEKDVIIAPVEFPNLDMEVGIKTMAHDVPKYAIPLGAAWRATESSDNSDYHVDLTPFKIREEQKVLKLGPVGWTLFALIPLLTFVCTLKISQYGQVCSQMQRTIIQKKSELTYLQDVAARVDTEKQKYAGYVNSFGIIDSLVIGTYTWSAFLSDVTTRADIIGNIWITEISKFGTGRATIKGYALDRTKIPAFSDLFSHCVLKQVQVQEIDGKTVFSYELETDVIERRPYFDKATVAEPAHEKTAQVLESDRIVQ
ncbi:MAG: hypothetical protein ACOY90_00655 [Candidatus Zhuqueibacterota bacterium]